MATLQIFYVTRIVDKFSVVGNRIVLVEIIDRNRSLHCKTDNIEFVTVP
jgi:hypothetical protein